MTRQIICLKCAEARTPGNYPGEWWKRVRGIARGFHNGDFVCDLCNEDIPKGTECVAQSFGRNSQPYESWEFDYLGDDPGVVDGTVRVIDGETGEVTEHPPRRA